MGQGFLGHFGYAKETAWGTAVAAADYAEIMSSSLREEIARFETRNVFGGFYEPDDSAGLHTIIGDIVMSGHPVPMGAMLKAIFQNISQQVVLSGFLWTLNYTGTKSEFAAGVAGQPYTIEMYYDITSAHRFIGCVMDRMQMTLAPNQDLRLTTSWIGREGALITATTPTFPGSPAEPFTFDTCSVQLAGAATARVEALTLSIDNQLEGVPTLNNATIINSIRRRGPQMIRISGTMNFDRTDEFVDFKNQTERAMLFSVTKAQSFHFLVDMPRMVYRTFPVGIPGRDRLTVAFEGNARYLASSASAILCRLTTTRSNY